MEDQQTSKLLSDILSSLNSINDGAYQKVLERHVNSIDFITEGKVKKFVGIIYHVDQRLSIILQPEVFTRGSLIRMRLNLVVQIQMKDFTTNSNDDFKEYNLFHQFCYPFVGPEEKCWQRKIRDLNKRVVKEASRLLQKYTPSHRLAKIVGREPKPKYQILDLFSKYIISNKLRLSNGSIKIEGDLKPFFRVNTHTVCENTIFDTLRDNTLTTENQLKLIASFQTHQLSKCRHSSLKQALPESAEYFNSLI